ncbi:MAG: hypothetical protein IKB02_08435 [Clostridia bacterium]|nr:hypothetical protein [Clostridia bacterium]
MKKPFISGEWKILFKPEKYGNYVNDHSIVKDSDDKWHLFGITSFGGGAYNEKYFVHGVGDSLDAPMAEVQKTIDCGTPAWAPCIIGKDGNYYMFYGPSPTSLAVSFELYEWFGYPVTLKNEPPMAAHRDHFVIKVCDEYLMYVSGIKEKKGAISLFSSKDLLSWEFCDFALTSGDNAPLRCPWGAMESPFVVEKDGFFYLFVTYTDSSLDTYNNTLVFVSDDPKNFGQYDGENSGAAPIARIKAHAPEIIKDGDKYFITTCGWNNKGIPHEGCVSIAELKWK